MTICSGHSITTFDGHSVTTHCVLGSTGRVTAATDDVGGRSHDRAVSNAGWRTCKRTGGQGHKVGA